MTIQSNTTAHALQLDQIRLESRLLNSDLPALMSLMDSREVYSAILKESAFVNIPSSTYYISWYARKRATALRSEHDKARLLEMLQDETSIPLRKNIYYALSHICGNTQDGGLYSFLLERLQVESDLAIKRNILCGLEGMKKDRCLPVAPIFDCLDSPCMQLRLQAIRSLKYSECETVECFLIRVFKKSRSRKTRIAICYTLESIGTHLSIELLKSCIHRTKDLHYKVLLTYFLDGIKSRVIKANLSVA